MSRLFMISAASLFLLAPVVQHQVYGLETTSSTTVIQQNNIINDENIRIAVKDAILADRDLAKFVNDIQIGVDKGVVTLSGFVDSAAAKANLDSKVKAVMGVKKVINNVEIKKMNEVK